MRAAFVEKANPEHPLSALRIGARPEPDVREGWTRVKVEAAAINHHDVWSLRGVGLPAGRMPMVLGTDATGITEDGKPVIVHSVISQPGWRGDETYDPKRTLLSELHQGTQAEWVAVPSTNLVDRPDAFTPEEASCLPTAWLTAYRMLTHDSGLTGSGTVLVQGAGGGVAAAAIVLGKALGHRVWVCARTEDKRQFALQQGADAAFEPGVRLPERVDAVVETVGEATWQHSLKSLRPGGTVIVCGATSGANPVADLNRVFFLQLRVIGSTMGTRQQLQDLIALLLRTGVRPHVDRVLPLEEASAGYAAVLGGEVFGKVVLRP